MMIKITATAFAFVIAVALISACHREAQWKLDPSANFFPLKTNMVWTYRIASKSQGANYVVTDRVIGSQYVPALKLTGLVVEEVYNLDRAGLRPIVYLDQGGFLTRLSGLDYVQHQIQAPAWGRSEEDNFLPTHLTPDMAWKNTLLPYGTLPGGFDVAQSHRSFIESEDIVVPAGDFKNCIRIETAAHYEGGIYADQKRTLDLSYKDWYAPNVGLVRTLAYEGGPAGQEIERVELTKFQPISGAPAAAPGGPPIATPQASPPQSNS